MWLVVFGGSARVFFPPSHSVPSPFNDDLGTPPTWWKNNSEEVKLTETATQQGQLELEGPAASAEAWRGA